MTSAGALQAINTQMGWDPDHEHQPNAQGFATFVHALVKRGMHQVNPHFKLATTVTDDGRFAYDYYLQLESLARWLPCFAHVRPLFSLLLQFVQTLAA